MSTVCLAHLSGSGIRNVGAYCRRPAVDAWDGSPRCAYHMGVERRREARRNAPHVHRAWARTMRDLPDGTIVRFCAECGASF